VDVWAASVKDEPGALARLLAGLREAGADLDFIIARRAPEQAGMGVVFVTPLRGGAEVAAAAELGFNVTSSVHSVRVDGENRPGVAAELTEKLAAGGINLRGLSAAVIGTRFIVYIALDTAAEATKAIGILQHA
jgi:hypothetical protein